MTWDHRVVRKIHHGEQSLGIHEVFYDEDAGTSWTEDPVEVVGDSIEDLRETLERMLSCLEQPIIEDIE
jgi:hypothetical protein